MTGRSFLRELKRCHIAHAAAFYAASTGAKP